MKHGVMGGTTFLVLEGWLSRESFLALNDTHIMY